MNSFKEVRTVQRLVEAMDTVLDSLGVHSSYEAVKELPGRGINEWEAQSIWEAFEEAKELVK